MAAATSPIFVKSTRASWASSGTSANTAKDGTGTVNTIFTADATNGSKIEKVVLQHLGTNVATVLRFFVNNGSTNATATNNSLVHEEGLAAWTNSEVAASTSTIWFSDLVLPPGYKLNVVTATAIASGVQCTGIGGDY